VVALRSAKLIEVRVVTCTRLTPPSRTKVDGSSAIAAVRSLTTSACSSMGPRNSCSNGESIEQRGV